MNKSEAYKKDLAYAKKYKENPFFVDEEDGIKYIFGMGSNFAYSSPKDPKGEIFSMWTMMKGNLGIKESLLKETVVDNMLKDVVRKIKLDLNRGKTVDYAFANAMDDENLYGHRMDVVNNRLEFAHKLKTYGINISDKVAKMDPRDLLENKMKKSELRNIIREEINKLLKEGKFTNKFFDKLFKRNKVPDVTVFVNGIEYAFYDALNNLDDSKRFFGSDGHGNEKELKYSDIEFVTVDGKRITKPN